jgi:hypothetical protein
MRNNGLLTSVTFTVITCNLFAVYNSTLILRSYIETIKRLLSIYVVLN